ncbi:MAG TPA: hypothetical protein VHT51_21580 [Micropepsaceae bacterium]|nr:hypothetical protein [Micropepsaceae bacterium]
MARANHWNRSLDQERQDSANQGPVLTPEEARQGVVSGRIRMLLAVSLTLVIVAFAIIYAVHI